MAQKDSKVLIVLLWEAFCTVFSNDRPTILAELFNFFFCRRRKPPQAEKRAAVASILYHKMDEFTLLRPATHFWCPRTFSRELEKDAPTLWDVEESSAGPTGFVPRPEGCVIFFANHTMTITSQRRVAEIVLLRVGNLSSTASADLATVDGTAYAGHSYIASKQRVVFAPNVATATFQVELLPMAKAISHSFFVAHVEAIHGRATMSSSSFIRIRLVPEGLWPPGAAVRLEGKRPRRRVERVRLVWRFGHLLLKRRGAKLWYVLASIIWLDFHKVVLNTLLLNYALFDFCLTPSKAAVR